MARASPEVFDKKTFLDEILNEPVPERLLRIRNKYASSPYCSLTYCYSITNIIYQILDEEERKAVLKHIQTVCKDVPKKWHVLSDIDDTIRTSILGGTNVKYKNHTVYPGVVPFYSKIIKTDTDFLTLLSARPEAIARASRGEVSKMVQKPVDMLTGNWCDMPLAAGDTIKRFCVSITPSFLHDVGAWLDSYPTMISHITGASGYQIPWHTRYLGMGLTKFSSIEKYITIYPEFEFIFIGDSGQGDLMCAHEIYKKQNEYKQKGQKYPVKASFIHNILKAREVSTHYDREKYVGPIDPMLMISESLRNDLKKRDIYVFNNYIDLAGYTSCLGILSYEDLQTISTETIADFNHLALKELENDIKFESKKDRIYYDTPLFISYIEDDLLRAQTQWREEDKICK
jgi:hypothetical protein